jgi:hypothetical protein
VEEGFDAKGGRRAAERVNLLGSILVANPPVRSELQRVVPPGHARAIDRLTWQKNVGSCGYRLALDHGIANRLAYDESDSGVKAHGLAADGVKPWEGIELRLVGRVICFKSYDLFTQPFL